MRHRKKSCKLGRTTSHRRCMFANMLKSLVIHEKIETTTGKGKELKRLADKLITLAKKGDLAARRKAIAELMIRFNPLTPKEQREVRVSKKTHSFNQDRLVIDKLFGDLQMRFVNRQGGYTRLVHGDCRVGDNAPMCVIEYLAS